MATEAQEIMAEVKAMRAESEERAKDLAVKHEGRYTELTGRIDALETRMKRPGQGDRTEDERKAEAKKAFFAYLRKGFDSMAPEERKALVQGTEGNYIVPEDLEAEIYRELPSIANIRALCRTMQTNSNRIRKIAMTEVDVGWGVLERGASLTESTLVPSQSYDYVEDCVGLTKIGEDQLADTNVNLQAYIASSFAEAFAEAEEEAFIAGAGHDANEPEGILTNASVTRVTCGAVGNPTLDDLIDAVYALPAKYHKNATFVMNTTTAKVIRKLKDEYDQYIWQPNAQAGQPAMLLGYPVVMQNDVPEIQTSGTEGDIVIFGDFRKGYRIIDRQGMELRRLNELYAESGLVGFRAIRRVGGSVVRTGAFRVLETKD
ncbi:MAG: phage major capsid protein [Acidobacteriota bacterium]|nr:phage major capsid protein [Acidobacteriota bacterium]